MAAEPLLSSSQQPLTGDLPKTMKMAVGKVAGDYSKEGMLQWEDGKVPEVKDDFVLIDVKAVAMNRIDVLRSKGAAGQGFPIKPLSDVAGIVVARGPNVKKLKAGDEVISCIYPDNDGLAEYVLAKENWVGLKPAGWSFPEGAALTMTAVTANTTLKQADISSSTEIVVLGASGGVGAMMLALNRGIGAPIVAVASAAKADFVKAVGGPTVTVVDYKKEDWTERFKDKKPYAVLHASSVSPVEAYNQACKVGAKKFLTLNAVDPSFQMSCGCLCKECCFQGKACICSSCCGKPTYKMIMLNRENAMELFKTCAELAEKGEMQPPLCQVFAPAQVHMAYGVMSKAEAKAVIDMSNGI